jgi:hypothetical protein
MSLSNPRSIRKRKTGEKGRVLQDNWEVQYLENLQCFLFHLPLKSVFLRSVISGSIMKHKERYDMCVGKRRK